jgi:hypothetical protein
VQSAVERRHQNRGRDPDTLAESVLDAWNNLPMHTIQKVFDRIPIVLQLIVNSNGDSVDVEDRRGHNGALAHLPE